jgi:hypothetical protein
MGGAAVSFPRIPLVYDPPPSEKYVFRVLEGGSSSKQQQQHQPAAGANAESVKDSRKRSGSIVSAAGLPLNGPELNRRNSKIGLLQPQNSSLLTGELQRGMSVGALKAQASIIGGDPAKATLRSQGSKAGLSLTANNSDDGPHAPGLSRKNSMQTGGAPSAKASGKKISSGQRVSAKHPWILKGGSVCPRSSADFEIGRVLGK